MKELGDATLKKFRPCSPTNSVRAIAESFMLVASLYEAFIT